jgi:hypothetical protein
MLAIWWGWVLGIVGGIAFLLTIATLLELLGRRQRLRQVLAAPLLSPAWFAAAAALVRAGDAGNWSRCESLAGERLPTNVASASREWLAAVGFGSGAFRADGWASLALSEKRDALAQALAGHAAASGVIDIAVADIRRQA